MKMKIVHSEKRVCSCCMEEHEVKAVLVSEESTFKGIKVEYEAAYMYCDAAEELYVDEQRMQENDIRLKDAYRKAEGLLTSTEITDIRSQYGITQSDLCVLLGWGGKTIARYERHQVQDNAHDMILKKLARDSEWFLALLRNSKEHFSEETYQRYLNIATELYEKEQNAYLYKAIKAQYTRFQGDKMLHGNAKLALDRVVDMIRYFAASQQVTNLYKVKLMKLMWYADFLSYKQRGQSITGLVYQALPMGAVPVAHNLIIDLEGVPCEEVDMGETNAYFFSLDGISEFPSLSDEDRDILDAVIAKLGKMSKKEIVSFMHKEEAYIKTIPRDMISYEYAKSLQIG